MMEVPGFLYIISEIYPRMRQAIYINLALGGQLKLNSYEACQCNPWQIEWVQ